MKRFKKSLAIKPLACALWSCVFLGCSKELPEDLLDRSTVMEISFNMEADTSIPHGVGGYALKKKMHQNGGWKVREGDFTVLLYQPPYDDSIDQRQAIQALEAWAGEDGDQKVLAWIDGNQMRGGPSDESDPQAQPIRDIARYVAYTSLLASFKLLQD